MPSEEANVSAFAAYSQAKSAAPTKNAKGKKPARKSFDSKLVSELKEFVAKKKKDKKRTKGSKENGKSPQNGDAAHKEKTKAPVSLQQNRDRNGENIVLTYVLFF